jgi:OFA family oxalate/formate antiporter-like MFS transporter
MKTTNKRWISLIAGLLIEFCLGLPYSWSLFQNLLAEKYSWSIPRTALAYSIASVVMLVFTLFLAGPLVKKLRIKKFLLLGCLLYGGGTLACGFIRGSLWELYVFNSLAGGVGTAILYPTLTSYAVRIFPDKPGFANGLMIAGYGCSPFVLSPVIAHVYGVTNDISKVYILLGGFFLAAIFLLSFFIIEPENLAVPVTEQKKSDQPPAAALGRGAMLKTPVFYVLYITFAFGIINATMLLTQSAPILRSGFSLTYAAAAGFVGVFALSNTAGRLLCGVISDKLGRPRTVTLLHIFSCASFVVLLAFHNLYAYVFAIALCIFCLGGFAASLAPATSETFGSATLSENYSIMFSIFSAAGIIGVQVITNIGYTGAYIYGAVTAGLGIALSFVYQRLRKC